MTGRLGVALAVLAAALMAQGIPPSPGTVSGVIRDIATKEPVAGATVFIPGTPSGGRLAGAVLVTTTADDDGRYSLSGVPAGRQNIQVRAPNIEVSSPYGMHMSAGQTAHRVVQLSAGQDLSSIDILVDSGAQTTAISGRVVDEDGEPVSGMTVRIVRVEYQLGVLRYFSAARAARTNDQGRYELRVPPGVPLVVMASSRQDYGNDAASRSPADPQRRKQVYIPAFFPNSRVIEGAERVVLRPGEIRDHQDIHISTSLAYCADGAITSEGSAAQLSFQLDEPQPTDSLSSVSSYPPFKTAADGKFRVCDLHPGAYRLTANKGSVYGAGELVVGDRDLHGIKMDARNGYDLSGAMVWAGTAPDPAVAPALAVSLNNATGINRRTAPLQRDSQGNATPGPFVIQNVNPGDYQATVNGVPKGAYLKDAVYGPASVLRRELHFTGGEAHLTMTVAWDGGTLSAKVQDKDGKPVADAYVCLIPASVDSEPNLQADLTQGKTDLDGIYTSGLLPPGKYHVLAILEAVLPNPVSIHRLWQARSRGADLEIGPSSASQLILDLATLQ